MVNSHQLKVRVEGHTIYLMGRLDEFADFTNIPIPTEPVEINCRDLGSSNSIGIRNFVKLIKSIGTKKFNYTECPLQFVDCINTFSYLLGFHKNGRIESINLDFICKNCFETQVVLTDIRHVVVGNSNNFHMVVDRCTRCANYLSPRGDLSDILEFVKHQRQGD
jgi:hypothetical protein